MASCAKDYIEVPSETTPPTDAITLASTYSSVDFSEFNLEYNGFNIFQLQIRRESNEPPLTVYDGELVAIDTVRRQLFKDYKVNDDLPSLLPDSTYYYAIFYTAGTTESSPVRVKDFEIRTLTYQQGMLQLLSELIDYSHSKKDAYDVIVSTELVRLFFDNVDSNPEFSNPDLINKMDGILVPSLMYSKTDTEQSLDQLSQNVTLLSKFPSNKLKLAIDYLSVSNGTALSMSKENFDNNEIIGFNRPGSDHELFSNLPGIINEAADSDVQALTDDTLKNFVFVDKPVSNLVTHLKGTNYDLIIMTPFKSSLWGSLSDVYDYEDVQSLKTKSNGVNRLVFAYIDIGRIIEGSYYLDASWNVPSVRPNWIDKTITTNSNDHYVKYWRREWSAIIKPVIDLVIDRGYDGIVFGGAEVYKNYPLTN
jgi:hypothetical protein